MATRQYIGARYVPKFYTNTVDGSTQWEANVVYEPLIYVTLINGHMYISKKQVPATVGSPAENIEYWLDIGSYNGMIEDLQNQIDALSLQVNGIDGDVDDLQAFETQIKSSLRYPVKNVMLIMDSYGGRTNSGGKTIAQVAALYSGMTVDCIFQTGAGILNGTITSLVQGYTGDGSKYDTVIYVGGANDVINAITDYSNFGAGFNNLKAAIDAKFPNAKNVYVMPSSLVFKHDGSTYTTEKQRFMLLGYRNGAIGAKMGLVANAEYVLRNTDYLDTDMIHPNGTGVTRLGQYIAQFLVNGYFDVYDYAYCTLSGVLSSNYTFLVQRRNNVVTISGSYSSTLIGGYSSSIAIDSQIKDLGTFDKMLVCCDGSDSGHYRAQSNNQLIFEGSSGYEPGGTEIYVYNKHLYAGLVAYGTGGVVGKWYIVGNTIIIYD